MDCSVAPGHTEMMDLLQAACIRQWRPVKLTHGELESHWSAVAMPVLGPSGVALAALELRFRDLARDVPAWRPALAVAARRTGP